MAFAILKRLRPEEKLFLCLLGLVIGIHAFLRESFFVFIWLEGVWAENQAFRLAVFGSAALLLLVVSGLLLTGSRGRRYLVVALKMLRDFLPFGFMFVIYESLHSVGPRLHGQIYDSLLAWCDEYLFGVQVFVAVPAAVFAGNHVRAVTFYFAFCYSAVFIVYWGMAIYFFCCFDRVVFRKYMLSIVLTSFLGYLGYIILPALGPYEAFMRPGGAETELLFTSSGSGLISRFADHIRGFHFDQIPACDAFPSLHTAWTLVVLGFSLAYARWLLILLVPWAVGTLLGALYFQQHYLIDFLAGVPVALAGCVLASRACQGTHATSNTLRADAEPETIGHSTGWRWEFTRIVVLAYFRLFHCVRYRGVSNIPLEGAVIFAPNHESYYDPPLIAAAVPYRVRFMTWDALFRVPFLGWCMTAYGAFPVRSSSADKRAIEESLKVLRHKQGIMIFPEGGRTPNGELQKFEQGVARLASQTGAVVVPVTILGGYKAWPRGQRLPRWFRPINVKFHPPISNPVIRGHQKRKERVSELNRLIEIPIRRRVRAADKLKSRRTG